MPLLLYIPPSQVPPYHAACCSGAHFTVPDGIHSLTVRSCLMCQILREWPHKSVHVRPNGRETPRALVIDPRPSPFRAASTITRSEHDGICVSLSAPGISVQIEETKPYRIAFLDSAGHQLLLSDDPFSEARRVRRDRGSRLQRHSLRHSWPRP